MSLRDGAARDRRALSPVVGTLLLVGVTLLLASAVATAAFGHAGAATAPAPTVAQSAAEYETYAAGGGRYRHQVIRVTHLAGDTLDVSALELVVDASDACGKVGRLVNLPAAGDSLRPTEEYVRGEDLFDNSYGAVEGPIGTGDVDDDGEWSAGETAQFRVATSECRLDPGETLTLRVVHAPTGSVVVTERVRAG